MTPDKTALPTIELHLKNPKNSFREKEFVNLRKDDIIDLLASLGDLLRDYNVVVTPDSDGGLVEMLRFFTVPQNRQKLHKDDLTRLYLAFTSDIDNIIRVASKSRRLKNLWLALLPTAKITSQEAEKILGREITVRFSRYWGYNYFVDALLGPLFIADINETYKYKYYYGAKPQRITYTFSLTAKDREHLARTFLGEDSTKLLTFKKIDRELDADAYEDYEAALPGDIIYLSGLGMSDSLATDNPATATKVRSLKKNFKTPQFPHTSNPYPMDRTELLFNSYSLFYRHIEKMNAYYARYPHAKKKPGYTATSVADFARFVVENLSEYIHSAWFNMFFPNFKSFTKGWSYKSEIKYLTELIGSFLKAADDTWLSLETLKMSYLITLPKSPRYKNYIPLFDKEARSRSTLKRRSNDEEVGRLDPGEFNWFEEIDYPFLLNWIRLLCSCGLVKMAHFPVTQPETESVTLIKLTDLGRYAYGLEKDYRLKALVSDARIDIDDTNCILTLLGDNNPYRMFLSQTSEQIGRNRFLLTAQSIVKNCETAEDVQAKIDNLDKIVDLHKHPGLESITQEALGRTNCLSHWPNGYTIYRLNSEMPEFIAILTSIPEIRRNIVLAEEGLILVLNGFDRDFRKLCAKHGYII